MGAPAGNGTARREIMDSLWRATTAARTVMLREIVKDCREHLDSACNRDRIREEARKAPMIGEGI